jgi:hypothetical protein
MNATINTAEAPTVRFTRPGYDPMSTDTPTTPTRTTPARTIDSTRLWTGGLATAVVAALVGLVGSLVVRAVLRADPTALHALTVAFGSTAIWVLCATAAGAALAATGLAHLLLVSAPRPVAYVGWVVGLVTAAATVLPLASGAPLAVALALGAVYLVIGLAIGSLVTQAMISAGRYALD